MSISSGQESRKETFRIGCPLPNAAVSSGLQLKLLPYCLCQRSLGTILGRLQLHFFTFSHSCGPFGLPSKKGSWLIIACVFSHVCLNRLDMARCNEGCRWTFGCIFFGTGWHQKRQLNSATHVVGWPLVIVLNEIKILQNGCQSKLHISMVPREKKSKLLWLQHDWGLLWQSLQRKVDSNQKMRRGDLW